MKVLSQNDVVTYPHVFKWVYGNPLTFLVGIRRIPTYHVDYTTGEGEWCGTGAYAANGGMLILELDDEAVGHGGRSGVRPGLWMVQRC